MKSMTWLLFTLVLTGLISSCKKGEDDPFLSLRSRKARLAGEWKLTKLEMTETFTDVNGIHTTTTIGDGATKTVVFQVTPPGEPISTVNDETTAYTQTYTFEKDGGYTMTSVDDENNRAVIGNWFFLGKSKKNELKNKEGIVLYSTSSTENGEVYTSTVPEIDYIFAIRKLSSKELVLTFSDSYSDSDGNSGSGEALLIFTKN